MYFGFNETGARTPQKAFRAHDLNQPQDPASMRLGRERPRKDDGTGDLARVRPASMRLGRERPRKSGLRDDPPGVLAASMRLGRERPRKNKRLPDINMTVWLQ